MDQTIRTFYERGEESGRLLAGNGRLEYLRVRALLRRFLRPGSSVVDVGGAAGIHSRWLAEDGHDVLVVDPVPLHVEQASAAGLRAVQGLASDLPDGPHDAVLLMGPLYHLLSRAERVAAWREACRVVRPGGLVAAEVITRHASMWDGLRKEFPLDPRYRQVVSTAVATGEHHPPADTPWFTKAYFHQPWEGASEAAEAGLTVTGTFAVEGPAWMLPNADLEAIYADPDHLDYLMWSLEQTERDESMIGVSSHLLVVTHRLTAPPTASNPPR
ncbi:class I SAM-dependent methyltransferase [Actinosynnema sp. NPDC020468]|uniref:class I SAM-dependent methyltransferase n=1 Tax=Actinosynnema sp. NPDC020468 TaxID=3154488 RepID=UPI0033C1E398